MLYGILYTFLSGILASAALSFSAWHLLLLWPALSFLLVGAAYIDFGPGVMGKQSNGAMSQLSTCALLPYLLINWGVWHVRRRLGYGVCCNEFAPGLYIGRRPLTHEVPKEVTMIVDLTCEFSELKGVLDGREYICVPTLDGHVPRADKFEELIRKLKDYDGVAYIHCAEGHGRAATVSAAVLIAKGLAADVDDAIRQLKKVRPHVRPAKAQKKLAQRVGSKLASAV